METDEILVEMADVLDRLAPKGNLVLGVAHEDTDLVTWDLSPDQAGALAMALRLALDGDAAGSA